MIKLPPSRKSTAEPDSQTHSPLPNNHALYLPSGVWVADLSVASPYPTSMSLSHGPPSQSELSLIPLQPLLQTSHHRAFSNMPVSAVEHGQNLATNSQLSWYTEPLLAASVLEDSSSQGSSQSEARLNPETPSFQAAERKEETLENTTANVKKPKRSRPNRYKNAPPAVIQRRRAANRKSQRAYRKRKDDRIAELEELLHQATQREREMSNAYMALRVNYEQLLMIGGPSNSHHSRSLSTASTATGITALSLTTAATSEEEDAASSFMAMAAFSHNNSSHHDSHHQHQNPLGLSPQMAHPQQQAAASPQLLSAYPPPPM